MSLSIIIPNSGNARIRFLLESLIIQDLIEQCEILLVSDRPNELDKYIGPYRDFVSIVPFREPVNGHPASKLRNHGADIAKYDRLLFIDNDIILGPGVVQKHLAHNGGVLCGNIRELPADSQILLKTFYDREFINLWKASISDFREQLFGSSADPVSVSWKNLYSGHFSVLKEDFRRAGYFDETGYRCHDLELGLRLEKQGTSILIDPTCHSIHLEHPRSLLTRIEQLNGWNLIAKNHPEAAEEMKRNAATSRYRIQDKLNKSIRAFEKLTSGFDGIRCGTYCVVKPGTGIDFIRQSLSSTPYEFKSKHDSRIFRLRLARDCWDFSVVVPSEGVLSMPFFSIIIPVWNAARFIQRAVESVFAQTFQSFEILIIDDASTDDYGIKLSKYFKDGRLRIFFNRKNQGLSKTLNKGLANSRGRYIVHLDSDDWLGSGCLDALYKTFNAAPDLAAVYGSPYVHDQSRTWREMGWDVVKPENHFSYPLIQAPRAYNRQALLRIGGWAVNDPFEGRYYEDRLTLARINDIGPVKYSDNATYNVHVNSNSLGRGDHGKLAASKYIILNNEAAKRGKLCNARFNGDFLVAELSPLPDKISIPQFTVVIPHRNRWDYLEFSIRSWLESDLPSNAEIIVVDDCSDVNNLFKFEKIDPRVTLKRSPEAGGAAYARNLGAELASGEFIIFADSDHIVPKDICRRMAIAHKNGADVVAPGIFGKRTFTAVSPELPSKYISQLLDLLQVEGKVKSAAARIITKRPFRFFEPDSGDIYTKALENHFTEKWLSDWAGIILTHGKGLETYPHRWIRVNTGLLSVNRALFESLKGFDKRFRWSMEDWEFGIRVIKAGGKIEVCPDAEPLHQVHPADHERLYTDAYAANLLQQVHPDIIQQLKETAKSNLPPGAEVVLGAIGQDTDITDQEMILPRIVNSESGFSARFFALTFDDGPHLTGTPVILRILEKLGVRATFFILASQVPSCVSVCKSILTAGHEIGLHGWDHTPVNQFEPDELRDSMTRSLEVIAAHLDYIPRFYRPPYGKLTLEARAVCHSLGMQVAGWDIAPDDWSGSGTADLIRQFTTQLVQQSSNPVILLHDGSGDPFNTADFLAWLIENTDQAIKFLTLSEFEKANVKLPGLDISEQVLDFESLYLENISLSDLILKKKTG